MATTPASAPADFILHSFNAFDDQVARDPHSVLDHTINCRHGTVPDAMLVVQTSKQEFSSEIIRSRSYEEKRTGLAISAGISGSYGVYSGSVKTSLDEQKVQSSRSYDMGFSCKLDCGTVSFNLAGGLSTLHDSVSPDLLARLDAIDGLAAAKRFTDDFGTHLITGVNLGGNLYLMISATATSESDKRTMSVDVEAKYGGVNNITATASVTSTLQETHSTDNFTASTAAIGGSAADAALIDPKDTKSIDSWAKSCTTETVRSLSGTVELWKLATNATAGNILQQYTQLVMLMQGLNHPSFYTETIGVQPFQENQAQAEVPAEFKIIGGGAAVTQDGLSYLTRSCPQLDQNGNITAWIAASHDLLSPADPGDELTAYAIAVHDPGNLLAVACSHADANAFLNFQLVPAQDGYLLTGGGAAAICHSGASKFLMESHPDLLAKSTYLAWKGVAHDYSNPADNVTLTVYAIGVKVPAGLTISQTVTTATIPGAQHGNARTSVPTAIAGGGASITNVSGEGNLLQQSYPSDSRTWSEYNKDLAGNVSPADATAYAMQLNASLAL